MGAAASSPGKGGRNASDELRLKLLKGDDPAALRSVLEPACCGVGGFHSNSRIALTGTGKEAWPLIHVASAAGAVQSLSVLLKEDAFVHSRGPGGLTALMVAAAAGEDACAVELLDHGAKVDMWDQAGRSAATYALWSGAWKVLHAMATKMSSSSAAQANQPRAICVRDVATAFTKSAVDALEAASLGHAIPAQTRLLRMKRLIDKLPSLGAKLNVCFDINDVDVNGLSALAAALEASDAQVAPEHAFFHRSLVLHMLQRGARLICRPTSTAANKITSASDGGMKLVDSLLRFLTADTQLLAAEAASMSKHDAYCTFIRPLHALNYEHLGISDAQSRQAIALRVKESIDAAVAAGIPDRFSYPFFDAIVRGDTESALSLLQFGRVALTVTFDRYECPLIMTPLGLQHGDSVLEAAIRTRNYTLYRFVLDHLASQPSSASSSSSATELAPLERKELLNGTGATDRSPLAIAIAGIPHDAQVRMRFVSELLTAGAAPDVAVTFTARPCHDSHEYRHEMTAVAYEALHARHDVMSLLLRAGANPNTCGVDQHADRYGAAVKEGGSSVLFAERHEVPGVLEAMRSYIQLLPRLKKLRNSRRGYRIIAAAREQYASTLPIVFAESRHRLQAEPADFLIIPTDCTDLAMELIRAGADPTATFSMTGKLEAGSAMTLLRRTLRRAHSVEEVKSLVTSARQEGWDLIAAENDAVLGMELPPISTRSFIRQATQLDFDPRAPPGEQAREAKDGISLDTRLRLHRALLNGAIDDNGRREYMEGLPQADEAASSASASVVPSPRSSSSAAGSISSPHLAAVQALGWSPASPHHGVVGTSPDVTGTNGGLS